MTALLESPIAPLIAHLLHEAEASDTRFAQDRSTLTADGCDPLLHINDYRAFYARTKAYYLAVSPATAQLLYMLARSIRARDIVEFGASFGVSTLHLAAALKDNGGGRLVTTEFEPDKAVQLTKNIAAAGVESLVEIREGDALETLAHDLPERIDLVLLDGAKPLYPEILGLLEPHFAVGTLIVADNADMCPAYLALVRDTARGYLSLPFAGDVELSTWLGT
jgi:predicted O-methyltransferase YrrM